MDEIKAKAAKLEKYKYPLIVLAIGIALMLIPSSNDTLKTSSTDNPIEDILACTQGVGRTEAIVSENGVVIVCDGADDARVRLDIIRAVSSYTGFTADKITILKMTQSKGGA